MKKAALLKIVNPILALLFLGQAMGGIFHDLVPYEVFRISHPLGGYALVVAVVVHVTLNWTWVKGVLFKRS
jgi:hypothetical protein